MQNLRTSFREPIKEIFQASKMLKDCLYEKKSGNSRLAKELLIESNFEIVREWTESIWGSKSPFIQFREVPNSPPMLKMHSRIETRMPSLSLKKQVIERDGYHCKFCGIPVIRMEVRKAFTGLFPDVSIWGRKNSERHAAFMTMWLQYDHILPHSRGGTNDLENIVITCAPCNYGRMSYTIEEVGIRDPRIREIAPSNWNGLEDIFSK